MEDFPEDPELELAARRFRLEREEEQTELEEMEEEARDRVLDLPFSLLELQWRGDLTRVHVAGRSFAGRVVHVGEDVVTLATNPGAFVDVRLDRVVAFNVIERSRESGSGRRAPDPRRVVARLREIADSPHEAEFGTIGDVRVSGRVQRVHSDHVVVRSVEGTEWLLPMGAIVYVVRDETRSRTRR